MLLFLQSKINVKFGGDAIKLLAKGESQVEVRVIRLRIIKLRVIKRFKYVAGF